MLLDLLKDRRELALGPGAMLLGGFALDDAPALLVRAAEAAGDGRRAQQHRSASVFAAG